MPNRRIIHRHYISLRERSTRCWGRRLQRADFDIVFPMSGYFTTGGCIWCIGYKWVRRSTIIISNSNIVTTFSALKFCSPLEQAPRTFGEKERYTLEFINLGKSALINGQEGDHPFLNGLPILGPNGSSIATWWIKI